MKRGRLVASFAAALALAPAAASQSRFPRFEAFFKAYRQGRIVYLDPGAGRPAVVVDSLGPNGRLAAALDELVESGSPEAASRLLALAAFSFETDAEIERERHAARQPWAVRTKAAEALGRFRRPETLDFLSRDVVLASGAYPPAARAAAARALGAVGHPGVRLALFAALRDAEPEVRAAAADALGRAGGFEAVRALLSRLEDPDPFVRARLLEATSAACRGAGGELSVQADTSAGAGPRLPTELAAPAVSRCLVDPDWRVRAAAADYFEAHPSPAGVEALIEAFRSERERLARGEGRKRIVYAILRALTRLAGSTVSTDDPERWRRWWESHRDALVFPPSPSTGVGSQATEATYFGIPVRTDRVVFVLDVSGSMGVPEGSSSPPSGRGPAGRRGTGRPSASSHGERTAPSKLSLAQKELLAVLDRLGPADRFNLVFFHGSVERLFDTVLPATPEQKAAAVARVRSLQAAGGTNLFGALEAALRIRGVTVDRFYTDADTVFLLSDGAPSAGAVVDRDTIAASIAAANRGSRIALHTIYFGPDAEAGASFMERLARENCGEFRRFGAGR